MPMDQLLPSPCCGAHIRIGPLIRWNRLIALERPNYDAILRFPCPACRQELSFPMDAPMAAA